MVPAFHFIRPGDLIYALSSSTLAKLNIGSTGKVLKVTGGVPVWGDDNVGPVYTASEQGLHLNGGTNIFSLALDGSTLSDSASGLKISSAYTGQSSIDTLGTITTGTWQGNTLGTAYGGTGVGTYSAGDILFAVSSSTLSKLNIGPTGKVLKVSGGVPVWGDDNGGTSYTASEQGLHLDSGANIFSLVFDGSTLSNSASGLKLSSAYTGQPSIDTLGTITTGIWQGNTLGTAYGGTGITTAPNNGQLLIGNGSGFTLANLTGSDGVTIANNSGAITVGLAITSAPTITSVANNDYLPIYTNGDETRKKITYNDLFSGVLGALTYQGTWNATTNSPSLVDGACVIGNKGKYYVVGVGGSTTLGGISSWSAGDWVVCNGTSWEQTLNTNTIASVFGRTGTITAQPGDYNASQITNTPAGGIAAITAQIALNELDTEKEPTIAFGTSAQYWRGDKSWQTLDTNSVAENISALYFTNTRAREAISNNITGLTYGTSTGVFSLSSGYEIPLTTSITNGGTAYTRSVSSWTAPLQFSGGTASIVQADTINDGFLSSVDWNTFNNKVATSLTINTTGPLTGGGNLSANRTISINQVGVASDGYLSSVDWGIFNSKQDALGFTAENIVNKSTNTALGTSNVLYPTQNAIKSYVDTGLTAKQNSLTIGSLTGTTNQISVTGGAGAIIGIGVSLSLPQDISTISSPSFSGLTIGTLDGILKASGGVISTTTDNSTNWNTAYTRSVSSWTGPLKFIGSTASIIQSSSSTDGYLSSGDWITFNTKQSALGFTPENSVNKSTIATLGTSDVLYPTQNAVKSYVDNKALGLNWLNPVELINVVGNVNSPVVSPVHLDGYILNTGANTGVWSGFAAGDLVQYQTNAWVKIKSLVVGDYFGVAFKSNTTPSGGMTGKKNYEVQITGGTSGAFVYTFTAPTGNDALFVQNVNAYYHNVTFTYSSSLGSWVQLSASIDNSFGSGLATIGSVVSLGNLTSDWTQAGNFNITTAGDINLNGGNLKTTTSTASLFNTSATTLNIGGAATTIGLGAAGAILTGGGALTINSGINTALTLDSGTTGALNIGTSNNSKTINFGTGTAGNIFNIGTNNTNADTISIGSTLDALSLSSTGLNLSTGGALTGVSSIDTMLYSANSITFAGAGSLLSTGANTLTFDSGTTGAVNIGTGSSAKIITLGNIIGSTALNINTGTGGSTYTTTNGIFSLNTGSGAINLGTDAVAKTITIGNGTGATTLALNAGTGGIDIGANAVARTINIGNITGTARLNLKAGTGGVFMTGLATQTNGKLPVCFDTVTGQFFKGATASSCNTSSRNYKHDIFDISLGLDAINQLRPVSFAYNSDNEKSLGFIAEEAALVDERLAVRDGNGVIQAVNSDYIIPILTKAIQEQQAFLGDISPKINIDGTDTGQDALIDTIQLEDSINPIDVIKNNIKDGKQFLTNFVSARLIAIRGYFEEVFAKKIHTEQICVKKSDGTEVCLNGDQVNLLLNNSSSTISSEVKNSTQNPTPTVTQVKTTTETTTEIQPELVEPEITNPIVSELVIAETPIITETPVLNETTSPAEIPGFDSVPSSSTE